MVYLLYTRSIYIYHHIKVISKLTCRKMNKWIINNACEACPKDFFQNMSNDMQATF